MPSPMVPDLQVVRKPEEGDFIGHLRAEGLMEIARIFQVRNLFLHLHYICAILRYIPAALTHLVLPMRHTKLHR